MVDAASQSDFTPYSPSPPTCWPSPKRELSKVWNIRSLLGSRLVAS